MRHAVLAAALAFHPRLGRVRAPVTMSARAVGRVVMGMLDRRRARIDAVS